MSLVTHLPRLWQILDCGFGFMWLGTDFSDTFCEHGTFGFHKNWQKYLLPVRLLVCEEEIYSLELDIKQ
jgi:hypothetical protein